MTDERYIYTQDIRDKKSAGRGALARKNGSKSKRCTLPSDHLTPAEIKRRHSPVETIKLNVPMTYAQLKTYSPDLQFMYLDNLVKKYGTRRVDLLQMLRVSSTGMYKFVEHLPGKLGFHRGGIGEPTPEWQEFIRTGPQIDPIPDDEEPPADETAPKPEPPHAYGRISGSITITGSMTDMIDLLSKMIRPDETRTFTVSF